MAIMIAKLIVEIIIIVIIVFGIISTYKIEASFAEKIDHSNHPNYIDSIFVEDAKSLYMIDKHYVLYYDENVILSIFCTQYYLWNIHSGAPISNKTYQKNRCVCFASRMKLTKRERTKQ